MTKQTERDYGYRQPWDLCAICGSPFTADEWDARHTGYGDDDLVHEDCCLDEGPCADERLEQQMREDPRLAEMLGAPWLKPS